MRVKRRIHLSESHPRHSKDSTIHCTINEHLFKTLPGYKLTISNHKIRILASDLAGLRHCIATLIQIFCLFYPDSGQKTPHILSSSSEEEGKSVNGDNSLTEEDREYGITSIAISDWPDFAMRAVLLDLNPYGRVPKIETLLGFIDVWALLKVNQFQAFFRVGNTDASHLSFCKR